MYSGSQWLLYTPESVCVGFFFGIHGRNCPVQLLDLQDTQAALYITGLPRIQYQETRSCTGLPSYAVPLDIRGLPGAEKCLAEICAANFGS